MLDGQAAGAHAAVVHAALAVGRVVPAPPEEDAAGTRRAPKISAAARGRQRDEAGRLGMQPPPPMRRAVHLDRALVDGEVADRPRPPRSEGTRRSVEGSHGIPWGPSSSTS